MSKNENNNDPFYRVAFQDYDSAQEAVRKTYIIAFALSVIHGLILIVLILTILETIENISKVIAIITIFSVVMVILPLWAGMRIKKLKMGLAPVIMLWSTCYCIYFFMINVSNFLIIIDKKLTANEGTNVYLIFIFFLIIPYIFKLIWNAFDGYMYMRDNKKKN